MQKMLKPLVALFIAVSLLMTAGVGSVSAAQVQGRYQVNGVRWIDVNLTTQTLRAYQGNLVVFQRLISSGTAKHPTTTGTFHIYAKLLSTRMTGGVGAEHYDLPNVPYTMYFYGGNALHGTYWHHNFGHPMSHGCINLSIPDSRWLYNWASVGTTVVVHY